MLRRGDAVPHFVVTRLDGSTARYEDVWQRRNVLLVSLPAGEPTDMDRAYLAELARRQQDISDHEAECVVTRDAVPHVPSPGIVIADRWGEIYLAGGGPAIADLPGMADIFECLRAIQHECPECQGEAR
jgi:hypothetical protein